MIVEYNRPNTLEEALLLLQRSQPRTVPLGGGTSLARSGKDPVAVVDLQSLNLNQIAAEGQNLRVGATATLQDLFEHEGLPVIAYKAIYQEHGLNMRNMITAGGFVMTADGRSPLLAVFHALDAKIVSEPGNETVSIGEWLPLRNNMANSRLITQIILPTQAGLRMESVARTPMDRPVITVALASWPSGRNRIVVGGWGEAPRLAFDGPEMHGAEEAVRSAFSEAGDVWASSAYRQDAAAVIIRRFLRDEWE